jgi:broad specificity phosphatase PhoE
MYLSDNAVHPYYNANALLLPKLNLDFHRQCILSLIESSLENGNKEILSFATNFKQKLLSIYPIFVIEQILSYCLLNKSIYCLRHAEAEHNMHKDCAAIRNSFHDPQLTNKGKLQCETITQELKAMSKSFDAIFISPLKRTMQTFFMIENLFNYAETSFILSDLIRGILGKNHKNIGSTLEDLKSQINNDNSHICTRYITKNIWWSDNDENNNEESENKEMFNTRIIIFLLWIIFRKEQNICIISHSKVIKFISHIKIKNANFILLNKQDIHTCCSDFLKK